MSATPIKGLFVKTIWWTAFIMNFGMMILCLVTSIYWGQMLAFFQFMSFFFMFFLLAAFKPDQGTEKKTYEFDKGEFCEEYPWQIILNSEVRTKKPCPHCIATEKKDPILKDDIWILPRGVSAWNEGGCNGTFVCLECIKEGEALALAGKVKEVSTKGTLCGDK